MNINPVISANRALLERLCKNAGSWFYWIAGVTAVITIINACGGSALGYLGLLVPTIAAADHTHGSLGPIIGGVSGIFAVAAFCALGYFTSKGAFWAAVTGMALYAIDAALFAAVKEWLGVALHAYALFRIFQGIAPACQLAAIKAAERAQMAQSQSIGAWYTSPGAAVPIVQPALAESSTIPTPEPVD